MGRLSAHLYYGQRSPQPWKSAKGLKYNGVYLRQAALEAPEHIGRAERQQGILKAVLKKTIKAFFVIGKAQMKQALVVSQEVKNDSMKRGGFTASQWVLGRYPMQARRYD